MRFYLGKSLGHGFYSGASVPFSPTRILAPEGSAQRSNFANGFILGVILFFLAAGLLAGRW